MGSGRSVEKLLDHLLHVFRMIFVVFFGIFGEGDVGTSGRRSTSLQFLCEEHFCCLNSVGLSNRNWARRWRRSPLQERPVGLRHRRLLGAADEIALLFVRNGPTLLGLTQLLQAVVEALETEVKGQSNG